MSNVNLDILFFYGLALVIGLAVAVAGIAFLAAGRLKRERDEAEAAREAMKAEDRARRSGRRR
ncbi:MAG: hypothetical protein Kow0059_20790 [Candidatus Sumerlaeia bacterium]